MKVFKLCIILVAYLLIGVLEYIPGDLVMTNGVPLGTAKDVVYRVTSYSSVTTSSLWSWY